jgi:hypothetical protein
MRGNTQATSFSKLPLAPTCLLRNHLGDPPQPAGIDRLVSSMRYKGPPLQCEAGSWVDPASVAARSIFGELPQVRTLCSCCPVLLHKAS